MHFVIDYVRNSIPVGWKANSTGWMSGNCPMCIHNGQSRADTRKRGGFRFEDDLCSYHCFNCGYKASFRAGQTALSGSFKRLLLKGLMFDRADVQRIGLRLLQDRTADQIFIEAKRPENYKIDWQTTELPEGSAHINDVNVDDLRSPDSFFGSCEHIVNRGLDFHTDWYYSSTLQHRSRIILPFRYKGEIVGYIARWTKDERKKETPKYLVSKPQHFVYNLDNVQDVETVVVTEGPFDALVMGGVALNGTALSEEQVKIINSLRKRVVVLPDFDKAGNALVDAALENEWDVAFPTWAETCKDANEAMLKYGRLFTVANVLDNVVTSSAKTKLLAKKFCK